MCGGGEGCHGGGPVAALVEEEDAMAVEGVAFFPDF